MSPSLRRRKRGLEAVNGEPCPRCGHSRWYHSTHNDRRVVQCSVVVRVTRKRSRSRHSTSGTYDVEHKCGCSQVREVEDPDGLALVASMERRRFPAPPSPAPTASGGQQQ